MSFPLLQPQPSEELQTRLIRLLSDGAWHHRNWIAFQLNTTIRAVRHAAHECHGQVISANDGLKLTVCATKDELDEAIGRARSQVSQMVERIVQTEAVWERRTDLGLTSVNRSVD